MAEENIIFPDEPLLIVERGWTQGEQRLSSKSQQTTRFDVLRTPTPGSARDSPPSGVTGPTRRASRQARRDFQFVAATEPDGRHDTKSQRLVRSHVRKQSSRRDRSHSDFARRGSTTDISEGPQRTGRERRASLGPENTITTQNSVTVPTHHDIIFPARLTATDCYPTLRAIFHPLSNYYSYHPDPIRAAWYQNLNTDVLLLEAVQVIVLLRSMRIANSEPAKIRDLLKSVHQQLIDRVGKEQISDATIGTVLCLAMVEYQLEDEDNHTMHRRGLRDMIEHRGGIKNLDYTLQLRLYIADIMSSIDQLEQLYFPRPGFMPHVLECDNNPAIDRMLGVINGHPMETRLSQTFNSIALITMQLNNAGRIGYAINLNDMEEACVCIQFELGYMTVSTELDQIYRYGSFIFMRPTTCESPWAGYGSKKTTRRIKNLFESLGNPPQPNRLLTWATYLAAMASVETPDHTWFLRLVHRFLRFTNCITWVDMKQELSRILWIERLHDAAGASVWQALQRLDPDLGDTLV